MPLAAIASTGCATLGNARGAAGALTSKSRTLFETSAVTARPPLAATSRWKPSLSAVRLTKRGAAGSLTS